MSSLSVEYALGSSLLVSVFEVSNDDMMENGIPSGAFLEREEEFDIIEVPFVDLGTNRWHNSNIDNELAEESMSKGIICARSSDDKYLGKWGEQHFHDQYRKYGVESIWGWSEESGLRPCAVYLRHCYLAAGNNGDECLNSFLDETFLVDRKTTIRQYLERYPHILNVKPPPDLLSRYSG